MTNYHRGRAKEYEVLKVLRAHGWYANRTAGSHGLVDVIGLKAGKPPLLIQVKYQRDQTTWRADANTKKLCHLMEAGTLPIDVEWWIYQYGVKDPWIFYFGGSGLVETNVSVAAA